MTTRHPKLSENVVARRQVLSGEVTYMVKIRATGQYLRFSEHEWAGLSLFDGKTSYEEAAERFNQQFPGMEVTGGELEDLVASVREHELIERTPAERSIVILEKLEDQRKKRVDASGGKDIFYWTLATVNPLKVYRRILPYLRWIWTPYFVVVTLLMFCVTAGVMLANWRLVREGMLNFWKIHEKTTNDIILLFCILAVIVVIHETAHALTCMNFGGEVDELGFMLIYFTPAFYANVSDAYLFDKKWHKYWVTLAGGYSELIICSFATYTWVLTQPDSFVHHVAYNVMVFAGISTILINFNPLMKLDGYYLLSDYLEVINLRTSAAGYLGYLIKNRMFGLSVKEPADLTPRKKRIYFVYSTLSTAYITAVLAAVILFVYRICTRNFGEVGILLGVLAGYLILRKRISKLMEFARFAFLDKRDVFRRDPKVRRWALGGAALVLLFLLVPFPHTVNGEFTLEPARQLPLRAQVEGFVAEVPVGSDVPLTPGTLLIGLRNDEIVAARQQAQAEVDRRNREANAALAAGDLAAYQTSLRELRSAETLLAGQQAKEAMLEVRAPFAGRVLTPRLQDLIGKHAAPGDLLCDFGDTRIMRARIRVSEFDFRELREGQRARLQLASFPGTIFTARVAQRSMAAPDTYDAAARSPKLFTTAQAAAAGSTQEGSSFSHFELLVEVDNPDGALRPGMTGEAKITPDHHGLAFRMVRYLNELYRSKFWW